MQEQEWANKTSSVKNKPTPMDKGKKKNLIQYLLGLEKIWKICSSH